MTSTEGASRADEESDNGRAFHELLFQWGVSAVNSFGPCEDTWFSGSGKSRRGDFVCVPSEWLAKATDCSIEHQMPLALESNVDHRAVQVTLALWPSLGQDWAWCVARQCTGRALAACLPLSKSVFSNRAIRREFRLRLAESLVFNVLEYATGTWFEVSASSLQVLRTTYMRVLRAVANAHRGLTGSLTHEQVLQQLDCPNIHRILVRARLKSVARLARAHVSLLLATLQDSPKDLWASAVINDFGDLKARLPSHIAQFPDLAFLLQFGRMLLLFFCF